MATPEQIADVRDWVGDIPDDDAVAAALDRFDANTDLAALAILRRRRTGWANGTEALKLDVHDDTAVDFTANLKLLDDLIGRLESRTGDTGGTLPLVTTAQIVRPGRSR